MSTKLQLKQKFFIEVKREGRESNVYDKKVSECM